MPTGKPDEAPTAPAAAPADKARAMQRIRLNPALAGLSAHTDGDVVLTHEPADVPADVAERMKAHHLPWFGALHPVAVDAS